jgi:outer membrane protein OmpA-like peptidoglycan-associated protein
LPAGGRGRRVAYVATESGAAFADTKDCVAVLLDVVEAKPMEAKMVAVDAATMAKDISATGKVAIYGLYFDTDKADLKPESTPSLDEIGKLLKGQSNLKVYIVGHTDNVGGFDYNTGLSQRRAKSVVDRLIQDYGISADRSETGWSRPDRSITSNDDEAGRARTAAWRLSKSRRQLGARPRG